MGEGRNEGRSKGRSEGRSEGRSKGRSEGRGEKDDLAAVVPKADAEAAIDALEAAGVYDDTRKVREHDAAAVELPLLARPEDPDGVATAHVERVIEQTDPDYRTRGLDALLRERGWSDDEVAAAPKSWAVVGDVVLVEVGEAPRPEEVGEALLALHGEADTVLARGGIDGTHRTPDVEVLAGSGDTETVHTEHGTRYALDLSRVMFAPGNQAERVRMGEVVESDERVLDMFAGIGYFTLPMARAGAHVSAIEKNPEAFRYLAENVALNDVTGHVDQFFGDCRDLELDDPVERVVMGYYDALGAGPVSESATGESENGDDADYGDGTDHGGDAGYVAAALRALAPGGVLHVHAVTPEDLLWDRPETRLHEAVAAAGREVKVENRRRVKSHSEGVWHVVLDARVV